MAGRPTGIHGVTEGKKQGVIRWGPELQAMSQSIQDLRNPLFAECFKRTEVLRKIIQEVARHDAPWGENRNNDEAALRAAEESGRKPRTHKETPRARPGLFAFKQLQKSGIVLGLSHGPRTVSRGYPYGISLENLKYTRTTMVGDDGAEHTFTVPEWTDGQGTYAIINPTLEEYGPRLLRQLDGALNIAVGHIGGGKKSGGSRVAKRF